MKQEIIDWYSERHYQPYKMFNAWSYSQAQVEVAMEHCYNKIVNEGKHILDSDVARYVKNVCKDTDVTVRVQELKVLYESQDKLQEYKRTAFGVFTISVIINILLWVFFITLEEERCNIFMELLLG